MDLIVVISSPLQLEKLQNDLNHSTYLSINFVDRNAIEASVAMSLIKHEVAVVYVQNISDALWIYEKMRPLGELLEEFSPETPVRMGGGIFSLSSLRS